MRWWIGGFGMGLALAIVAFPLGGARPVSVGASGQCYDASGNGGQDEASVTVNTDGPPNPTVVLPSGTGTVDAVAQAVKGTAANPGGDACTNGDTYDYAEVHAAEDGEPVAQVCFDGDVLTDGSCPTSPAGPGGPG